MSHRAVLLRIAVMFAALVLAFESAQSQVLDPTFPVTDWAGQSLLLQGDTLYVGGPIGYIGPPTGPVAAIETRNGRVAEHWPSFQGNASAIVADGACGCFVAHAPSVAAGVARGALTHIRADGSLDSLSLAHLDSYFTAVAVRGERLYFGGYTNTPGPLQGARLGCLNLETGALAFDVPFSGNIIKKLLIVDSTLYVAGQFTAVAGTPRSNLAALDASTGALRPWSIPTNGTVHALEHIGTTIYFAGEFTTAGEQFRSYAAAADERTAALLPFHPALDGPAYALAVDDASVYVAGLFQTAAGSPRAGVAAWRHDGTFRTEWSPGPSVPAFTWGPELYAIAVVNDTVFLGGRFTAVGGFERLNLAAVSATSGTVLPWTCHSSQPVYALSSDGARLFALGPMGRSSYGGCVRHGLAAIDVRTNQALDWAPRVEYYDTRIDPDIWDIKASDDRVFITGRFGWVNGELRYGLAAIDARTGAVRPELCHVLDSASALLVRDSTLYIGGYFYELAGVPRSGFGALDLRTLAVKPWAPRPSTGTHAFVMRDSTMFVHGLFDSINGTARHYLAEIRLRDGNITDYSRSPGGLWWSMIGVEDELWFGGYVDGALLRVEPMTNDPARLPVEIEGSRSIFALARQGDVVWAAGDFYRRTSWTSMDYDSSAQVTAFDVRTKRDLVWTRPFNFDGNSYGGGRALQANATSLFGAGYFQLDASQGYDTRTMVRVLRPDSLPPQVALLSPLGGETVVAGGVKRVAWQASDNSGIWSVDLYLSRAGRAGPWELIAAGITEHDGYDWHVRAADITAHALVRVVARDWGGTLAAAESDGEFAIVDAVTPTLIERFHAERTPDGVAVEWSVGDPARVSDLALERSEDEADGFSRVREPASSDGRLQRVLDRSASADRSWWYRLKGLHADGSNFVSPPVSLASDEVVVAFALSTSAPNPTRGRCVLAYASPVRARIRLSVLDVQGRERGILIDAERAAGRHVAELDASDLRPGLYWIRLQARGVDIKRKLVVVR